MEKIETYNKIIDTINNDWRTDNPLPKITDNKQALLFEYMIYDCMPERKANIFIAHYVEGKTYKEIAKNVDITTSRIGQIANNGMRILLRYLSSRQITNYDVQIVPSEHYSDLQKQTEDCKNQTQELMGKIVELNQQIIDMEKRYNIEDDEDREIDIDLFSVRTTNALKRANVNTIGELVATAPHKLMKVRQLGRGCFKEIVRVLNNSFHIDYYKRHKMEIDSQKSIQKLFR